MNNHLAFRHLWISELRIRDSGPISALNLIQKKIEFSPLGVQGVVCLSFQACKEVWEFFANLWMRSLNIILFCTKHPFFPPEPPPTPSASCFLTEGGNITLTCSIPEGDPKELDDSDLIRYLWECPPTIQCHRGSISSEAFVSAESDLSQNVQCIVSNPLFRTSASVSLSTCLPEGE